jgi:hypothetical protein
MAGRPRLGPEIEVRTRSQDQYDRILAHQERDGIRDRAEMVRVLLDEALAARERRPARSKSA